MADGLSRKVEELEEGDKVLHMITRPYWLEFQEILEEVEWVPGLKKIMEEVKADMNSHLVYTLENGSLHYKGRLVLSARSGWIPKLLAEFHNTTTEGHSGVYRTYRRIEQSLYWVGVKRTMTNFVATCLVCQQHKYLASSPQGLLQPLPIPQAI